MIRLFAAALVIACTLAINFAQEKTPVLGRGSASLPFEVTTVEGKAAWIVTGRGTIYVDDLMGGLANATNMRVSFTGRASEMRRTGLGYIAPDSGMTLKNEQLPGFVSEQLAGAGLTLVGFTTGNAHVASLGEASSLALAVSETELAQINDAEWVAITYVPTNNMGGLGNLLMPYRNSASQISEGNGALLITGPAERVRTIVHLLREADKPGASALQLRSYDLPDGVKADSARQALMGLFPSDVTEVQQVDTHVAVTSRAASRVNMIVAPSGNRLIVRANAADHVVITQAIAAMK